MTDSELLLAISDIMEKKLDARIQPITTEIQSLRDDMAIEMQSIRDDMKAEIQSVRDDMKIEIQSVRDDMKIEIQSVRDDMKAELQSVRDDMKTEVRSIRDNMKLMHNDIQDLKNHVSQIELHLENTTDAKIKLLAENYVPAAKKYEREAAKIEVMQTDIDIMKSVIREHSEKLQKIS